MRCAHFLATQIGASRSISRLLFAAAQALGSGAHDEDKEAGSRLQPAIFQRLSQTLHNRLNPSVMALFGMCHRPDFAFKQWRLIREGNKGCIPLRYKFRQGPDPRSRFYGLLSWTC